MTKFLVGHAPHIAFVLIGVAAFFWAAYRRPDGARAALPGAEPRREPKPARLRVRRGSAQRGLLALGPLVGALATGAVLYGMALTGARSPAALVWVHVGISMLALLLVAYKLADLRRAPARRVTLQRVPRLLAIVLTALFVPLLVTGIELLLDPRSGSFAGYGHLVASAWWTGLLLWHLRRYLVPALRTVITGTPAAPRSAEA